jgi:predicted glycoside hydrolase/deacetylase ChbG (UPF0249 family)
MQVRKFRITADDWGLTPAINLGILNLAQSGVVRRVSLMAWAPSVECHLNELLQVSDIELGLHLDFTAQRQSNMFGFASRNGKVVQT